MIIKKYFFALVTTLFFTLPVLAAYCPSPETIKPSCKVLVTEAMVETAIRRELKEYNLEKLDSQVIKEITQAINADPQKFYNALLPRISIVEDSPLVLLVSNKLDIDVYSGSDYKKVRIMLVYLWTKAREACFYKNIYLNLIGKNAIELYLDRVKNFEAAYFFSNRANPTVKGTLTRCAYRLTDGRAFDLIDNDQGEHKPQFKLNGDYRKHWTIFNNWGVYVCKGNFIKDCAFELEA